MVQYALGGKGSASRKSESGSFYADIIDLRTLFLSTKKRLKLREENGQGISFMKIV
jgi:hypothetical protein